MKELEALSAALANDDSAADKRTRLNEEDSRGSGDGVGKDSSSSLKAGPSGGPLTVDSIAEVRQRIEKTFGYVQRRLSENAALIWDVLR